jgi:hypothetical protein
MRSILRLVGIVYGLFGLTSLVTFWLYFRYGSSVEALEKESSLIYFGLLGICATNAIVGLLILYSLWSLKSWGRYLAIGFNVLWLGTILLGFIVGRIADEGMFQGSGPVLFFIGAFVLLPLAVTLFLLRADVKQCMEKKGIA